MSRTRGLDTSELKDVNKTRTRERPEYQTAMLPSPLVFFPPACIDTTSRSGGPDPLSGVKGRLAGGRSHLYLQKLNKDVTRSVDPMSQRHFQKDALSHNFITNQSDRENTRPSEALVESLTGGT